MSVGTGLCVFLIIGNTVANDKQCANIPRNCCNGGGLNLLTSALAPNTYHTHPMDQDASSDERAAVWAKFGKAVAEQDYDTTQALFDAGQLGGLYLKDELNLAWHHPEQLICLQNSGTDASYISDPQDLHSIDDIKALQEEGLDLRRSGHLYLQYVGAHSLRHVEADEHEGISWNSQQF
jgi:hypothetical protein